MDSNGCWGRYKKYFYVLKILEIAKAIFFRNMTRLRSIQQQMFLKALCGSRWVSFILVLVLSSSGWAQDRLFGNFNHTRWCIRNLGYCSPLTPLAVSLFLLEEKIFFCVQWKNCDAPITSKASGAKKNRRITFHRKHFYRIRVWNLANLYFRRHFRAFEVFWSLIIQF